MQNTMRVARSLVLVLAALAAAASANPNQPECAAASVQKYCCKPDGSCAPPQSGGCTASDTDCSAHCGPALSEHQQRKCTDGNFARLIGHECHACPEDAAATAEAPLTTTAKEMSGGTAPNAPNAEIVTSTTDTAVAGSAAAPEISTDDRCPVGYISTVTEISVTEISRECREVGHPGVYVFSDSGITDQIRAQKICAPSNADYNCCGVVPAAGGSKVPTCIQPIGTSCDAAWAFYGDLSEQTDCSILTEERGTKVCNNNFLWHELNENNNVVRTTCSETTADAAIVRHDFMTNADLCAPSTPRTPCCKVTDESPNASICVPDVDGSCTRDGDVKCVPKQGRYYEDEPLGVYSSFCPLSYTPFRSYSSNYKYNSCVKYTSLTDKDVDLDFYAPPTSAAKANKCAAATAAFPKCCLPNKNTDLFMSWQYCAHSQLQSCGNQRELTDCTDVSVYRYEVTNVDTIPENWRVSKVEGFTDEQCTTKTTKDIGVVTEYWQPEHPPQNMVDGKCGTYWENNNDEFGGAGGGGAWKSDEAGFEVRAEEELKCVKVYQPDDPPDDYTTTQVRVRDLSIIYFTAGPEFDTHVCKENSSSGLTGAEVGGIVGGTIGGVVLLGAVAYRVRKSRDGGELKSLLG